MRKMRYLTIILLLLVSISGHAQHPDLENILKSKDLSYLVHNHVASHNPMPHGWEKFTHAQSPLGRFTFPLVMAMHTGEVYSLAEKGKIIQHTTTSQEWLPWLYQAENSQIKVRRTVGKDIFMCEVLSKAEKNMVILEMNAFTDHYYRNKSDIDLNFNNATNQFHFKWRDYTLVISFKGSTEVEMCQNAQPLLRKFQGFDDVKLVDKSTLGCWTRNGIVYLGAEFGEKLTITMEVTKTPLYPKLPEFEKLAATEKQYWNDFFNEQVPVLKTKDKVVLETYYHAWVTFWSNRFEGGDGMTPYPYFASSAFMYPAQFFWDEFYHSVLLSNLKDKEIPYQFIKNFSAAQAPDGGMPGSLNFTSDPELYKTEVARSGSTDMQPIVLGVTLQYLKKKPGWPKEKVMEMYQTYNRYIDWLYKNKDADGNGLIEYTNSYNSGTDDSPRFDSVYPQGNHIGRMQPVECLEQNVWLSLMHHNLAEMAKLNGDVKASHIHSKKALLLEEKIEKYFWNEKDGFYYDINTITHQQIRVKTEFAFMAMFLKNVRKDRINRLVNEHLLNPKEFWTDYPIPSVALSEPSFSEENMWRGPVWPNVNWLICLALEQQGYKDIAKQLALKTVYMLGPQHQGDKKIRGPRFNEWFNPLTGQALGNENMSWACTVADLILRYLND
ncbi:MAG: trehalase family glycosidase [Bacteroidales bacterium]|nr:trehalase family glycosidase [Bacteroidales bacterium]